MSLRVGFGCHSRLEIDGRVERRNLLEEIRLIPEEALVTDIQSVVDPVCIVDVYYFGCTRDWRIPTREKRV